MKQNPTKNQTRGFALVVTISMMILLTVIAIGLLTLSGISLRTSSAGSARKTAEANARMALMLALGELQLSAGPDQRVTATANIAGGAGGTQAETGAAPLNDKAIHPTSAAGLSKGLTEVRRGTRFWTGVWKNRDPVYTNIYSKTPAQQHVQWLVSGAAGETSTLATPALASAGLGAGGEVTDSTAAVVLVGEASNQDEPDADNYVAAPLIPIAGVGNAAGRTVGRYAWWVGDEGVKAKINLVAPYNADDVVDYKTVSTQRSGWEAIDNFSNYPQPGPDSERLLGLVSLAQAKLLDASTGSPLSIFHSATTDSFGLLTDTHLGGLRYDLTSGLRESLPTSNPAGIVNGITSNGNIILPSMVTSMGALRGPKWSRLKEFSEQAATLSSGNLKVKAANSDNDYAISPVIVELRLLLGAKVVDMPAAAGQYKTYPCAKIALVLANPYSFPLNWEGLDLEIKYSFPNDGGRPSCIYDAPGQPAYVPKNLGEQAVFNKALFRVGSATLPPGGTMAYTQSSPVTRPLNTGANQIIVPLAPISSTNRADTFNNSLFLEYNNPKTPPLSLDVREASVTSMIDVELRPQNATTILRKIERFELDNSEYSTTKRTLVNTTERSSQVKPVTEMLNAPFALQLYGFQISQPGEKYDTILPSGDMGIRASTLRTFADFNLQATRYRKTNTAYNPAPYFMKMANSPGYLPFDNSANSGAEFTRNMTSTSPPWGRSSVSGAQKTILFSPPDTNEMMVSLAQFQHADLTADDRQVSVAHQPGNAFANSYASPFVMRQNVFQSRSNYQIISDSNALATSGKFFDISYLLNAALWDRYYFSTIPASGTPAPENQKIVRINTEDGSDDLRDPSLAASRLLINGAFNVNSTDKNAWKAFLAGSKHLKHPADTTASSDALFPRSLRQTTAGMSKPTGNADDSFSGFRRLDDDQLDSLAEEITKQVRLRGPFLSLSHFVNRALVSLTVNKELGRSGALQSALDNSGVNVNLDGTKSGFSPSSPFRAADDKLKVMANGSNPKADLPGPRGTNFSPAGEWPTSTLDLNPGNIVGIYADKSMVNSPAFRPEQGYRSTGIPGWLTQADVLQVIGPSITVRSDTFKIRAYGEALDGTGNVAARAWCEAVVQRTPDYVDEQDLVSERDTALVSVNQTFGRRFKLVSFRWLSSNEI
jgi:hypothetical protein